MASLGRGRWRFLKVISGLAPAGSISTDPIKESVRWIADDTGWVPHPHAWIVACDYLTGDRVVFGQEGSPHADIAQAVAASCAIPGYYCPEEIDGRFYVDGALHSMSNLDLLLGLKLDLVVVISPHSARLRFRGWDPFDRFTDATAAYQGAGHGVSAELIARLADAAHPGLRPDRTLVFDCPYEVSSARLAKAGRALDRFEREDRAFFERVRSAYLALAKSEPSRVRVIDASGDAAAVRKQIKPALEGLYCIPGTSRFSMR